MKNVMKISIALVLGLAATAEARSIRMCTQIAGVAQHPRTLECRGFTNGCQLDELANKGFEIANPATCKKETDFGVAPLNKEVGPNIHPTPERSASAMVCEGSVGTGVRKTEVRLAVITGTALSSDGALIELTSSSPTTKTAPMGFLATIRMQTPGINPAVGAASAGYYYENVAEKFQMFIPFIQPADAPSERAILRMNNAKMNVKCRKLTY